MENKVRRTSKKTTRTNLSINKVKRNIRIQWNERR